MKIANIVGLLVLSFGAGIASAEGPVNYPDEPALASSKSRAEVAADVLEARRLGLLWNGEIDQVAARDHGSSSKTRAQVEAELHEAQRLGLRAPFGERDAPIATAEQERQIAQAGLRAIVLVDIAGQ
jgi:hypothetical protein